jgi:hypothetical protein
MKEELITFETAKLAKRKGFNEESFYCYNSEGGLVKPYEENGSSTDTEFRVELDDLLDYHNSKHNNTFSALTQSLLSKWLRDKHNILISVYSNASGYLWEAMKAVGGTTMRWSEYEGDDEESGTYTTYEKAMEDALQYALQTIKK